MAGVAENLKQIKTQIDPVARAAGRKPDDIHLLGASKFQEEPALLQALDAGLRLFGENRVQEAAQKWPALRQKFPDIELHMIGHLQSNKAAEALAVFDVIETLDREKLADALAAEIKKTEKSPRFFIQVNIGEEDQKGGILPQNADAFIAYCRKLGLKIEGLMCIPPADDPPAPHFALLADIARRNDLKQLSMGMSGDFETAIKFGATHIRIGTALFGPRPTS